MPLTELHKIFQTNESQIIENVPETGIEKSWMVIRSLKTNSIYQGFKLSVGDIIKLGRVKFKIKEVKHDALIETMENESKEDENTNEVQAEISDIQEEENGE